MRTSKITAYQARQNFGKLLDRVNYGGESIVVEKNGEEVAVLVSIETFGKMKSERDAFFENMAKIAAEANLSDQQADNIIQDAIAHVRQNTQ